MSLTLEPGECVAILGPSGSGKTTLVRTILGLLTPVRGRLRWSDDQPAPPRGVVGYVPQNLGLVRNRTVLDNVLLGALPRLRWWNTLGGRFPAGEVTEAKTALARVGLGGRGAERIEDLSGGERRRVAVARALLLRPNVLVADEFLAELDPVTADEIIALLGRLRSATGVSLLFVEHDIETAARIADRLVILVGGRTVAELDAGDADAGRIAAMFRSGGR